MADDYIFGNEIPATAEDALEHYGVKGMRWGVRRDDSGNVTVKKKVTDNDIRSARAKVRSQKNEIDRQVDRTNLATGKQQDREAKKLAEMSSAFLDNPDRATALRLTNGEKYAHALIFVALPGAGSAAVSANAVGRLATRKAVETRQRRAGVKRY